MAERQGRGGRRSLWARRVPGCTARTPGCRDAHAGAPSGVGDEEERVYSYFNLDCWAAGAIKSTDCSVVCSRQKFWTRQPKAESLQCCKRWASALAVIYEPKPTWSPQHSTGALHRAPQHSPAWSKMDCIRPCPLPLSLTRSVKKWLQQACRGAINFHRDRRPRNHRCMHQALSLSTWQQHVVQGASNEWCSTCVSVVGQHLTCCYFGFSSILALVLVQSTRQGSFGPSVALV
jgi:hypothetical protein